MTHFVPAAPEVSDSPDETTAARVHRGHTHTTIRGDDLMINSVRRSRVRRGIASLAIGLVLVSACGGSATNSPPADDTNPFASITISLAPAASGPVTGHVGDTLTFFTFGGHDQVEATLVKVFDPAVPTDDSSLPAGAHWVGIELTIDNHSSDYMNESSQADATASDGTVLTTDDVYGSFSYPLSAFQGCTQTSEGEQDVQPYTHCESFVVPDGQSLTQVGVKVGGAEIFSSLVPTDQATWTVP